MPPRRVKLGQSEFDDAVKSNIEDFDMEPGEAVKSAVEEFELQGYDLSSIIKCAPGASSEPHPITVHSQALANLLESSTAGSSSSTQQLEEQLQLLQQDLTGLSKDDMQQALAVASKAGTVNSLIACAKLLVQPEEAASSRSVVLQVLQLLSICMSSPDMRAQLLEGGGVELLLQVLRDQGQDPRQQQDMGLAAAAAACAEAASVQDEDNKCKFVDSGFAADLVQLLQQQDLTPEAATAAAGALRSFTTADDERPPASKAFVHARVLAKTNKALQALLQALKSSACSSSNKAAIAVLDAVRQIAANDEICREFSDDGGVLVVLQRLQAAAADGPPALARSAAGALRQLANSDHVKELLAEHRALEVIVRLLNVYGITNPEVAEHALGLLVAMTLRMPAISAAAAEAGAVDALVDILGTSDNNGNAGSAPAAATTSSSSKSGSRKENCVLEPASAVFGVGVSTGRSVPVKAAVLRQGCMAVRNMVVRNPELRPQFLTKGAEELLRQVKVKYPSACGDVGSAALRDLGLNNYNS